MKKFWPRLGAGSLLRPSSSANARCGMRLSGGVGRDGFPLLLSGGVTLRRDRWLPDDCREELGRVDVRHSKR